MTLATRLPDVQPRRLPPPADLDEQARRLRFRLTQLQRLRLVAALAAARLERRLDETTMPDRAGRKVVRG
jgi:hypothetical protein